MKNICILLFFLILTNNLIADEFRRNICLKVIDYLLDNDKEFEKHYNMNDKDNILKRLISCSNLYKLENNKYVLLYEDDIHGASFYYINTVKEIKILDYISRYCKYGINYNSIKIINNKLFIELKQYGGSNIHSFYMIGILFEEKKMKGILHYPSELVSTFGDNSEILISEFNFINDIIEINLSEKIINNKTNKIINKKNIKIELKYFEEISFYGENLIKINKDFNFDNQLFKINELYPMYTTLYIKDDLMLIKDKCNIYEYYTFGKIFEENEKYFKLNKKDLSKIKILK